jgi:hypothetical protein
MRNSMMALAARTALLSLDAAFGLMAAGCGTRANEPMPGSLAPRPRQLSASISGAPFGPTHMVDLHGEVVECKTLEHDKVPIVVSARPSHEQWAAFRAALDSAGVWSWKAEYRNDKLQDGIYWYLSVEYRDRQTKVLVQCASGHSLSLAAAIKASAGMRPGPPSRRPSGRSRSACRRSRPPSRDPRPCHCGSTGRAWPTRAAPGP